MTSKNYILISGIFFALVALLHLYRAVTGGAFVVGAMNVPLLFSWFAFVFLGFMAYWATRLNKTP